MNGRPLANNFTPGAGIFNLVTGNTGKLVCGGVANTVTAGLDCVHLHRGQFRQDIWNLLEHRPVELDVLAGSEVYIALVIGSADLGNLADLAAGHHSVGNRNPQHGRQALDIESVLQAQRKECLIADLSVEIASGLISILFNSLIDKFLIVLIVDVH